MRAGFDPSGRERIHFSLGCVTAGESGWAERFGTPKLEFRDFAIGVAASVAQVIGAVQATRQVSGPTIPSTVSPFSRWNAEHTDRDLAP
ncbi:hypothetical protein SAMN02745673_01614 [Marinactinospora thermotolerans DSM 45154]|uniref:Uncharacterized protein n=1 Tax=Marinactinospora thermotolerans DSM 45154 TaxID=1122192 RepID=A0A1T4P3Q5_9ACTN|nr:hypothetical protein SAMN02745673_01614 [Marinactinospora thermotolerans DSM 45154]